MGLKTVKAVSSEVGHSPQTVSSYCRNNNVQMYRGVYLLNDLQVEELKAKKTTERVVVNSNPNQVVVDKYPDTTNLYTTREVAEEIGVSPDMIAKWCRENNVTKYPYSKTSYKQLRFFLNQAELHKCKKYFLWKHINKNSVELLVEPKEVDKLFFGKDIVAKGKSSEFISTKGLEHNFKKKNQQLKFDLQKPIDKVSMIEAKIEELKLKTELAEMDLKREQLARKIDKVMR